MKTRINVLLLICSMLMLCACDKEVDETTTEITQKAANFTGVIGEQFNTQAITRMTNNSWEEGDAIGVFAMNHGTSLANGVYNDYSNVKYLTSDGNGKFKAATGDGILFNNKVLDFIAYYPHQSDISENKYIIDVSDQSNLGDIDLLYSENATNKSIVSSNVELKFDHMLSMLCIELEAGDGLNSLEGLTTKITNVRAEGSFNLSSKEILLNENVSEVTTITSLVSAENSEKVKAISTAILIPGQAINDFVVEFIVEGNKFEWKPQTNIILQLGKRHTYKLKLTATGVVSISSSSISDWDDVEGEEQDDLIVKPEGGSGDDGNNGENGDGGDDNGGEGGDNGDGGEGGDNGNGNGGENGETPTGPTLLFAGADFEDWDEFESAKLFKNTFITQSKDEGRNGSGALKYDDKYISASGRKLAMRLDPQLIKDKSSISLYIKGECASGLGFALEKFSSGLGSNISYFNLQGISDNSIIEPSSSAPTTKDAINVGDQWFKVILDISSINLDKIDCFSMYLGSGKTCDFLIDDIYIE